MSHRRASASEIVIALLVLAIGLSVQVLLVAGKVVFARPLWIDEVITQGFVSAPSLKYLFTALNHGAETNLPTTFILMRWYCKLIGSSGPMALRVFSFISVILGLTGLYAALRLAFNRQTAAIAVLAVWSHHLIIRHAFDARFYGPMLAGATWFAFCLLSSRVSDRPARWRIAAGAVAVLLVTLHYFGCFCVALIVLFDWLLNRRGWRAIWLDVLTLLPAVVALAACVPLYLGERRSYQALTWTTPATAGALEIFLMVIFPAITIVTVLGFWWLDAIFTSRPADSSTALPKNIAGLFGLAFIFVPIVFVSFALQNVMINRYAIVTMAGMTAPLALMINQISSRFRIALAVALLILSSSGLAGVAKSDAGFASFIQTQIQFIESVPPDAKVVYLDVNAAYAPVAADPKLKDRVLGLGFDLQADETQNPAPIFPVETAQNFSRYFGIPHVATRAELDATPHFFLLGQLPDLSVIQQNFPIHTVRLIDPAIAEITLESGK